jgi:uncharacterized protein VirK/YbjX
MVYGCHCVTFVIDVQEVEAEVVHAFVKVVAGRSKKTHQVIYHFSVLCTSMKQKQCLESIHTKQLVNNKPDRNSFF